MAAVRRAAAAVVLLLQVARVQSELMGDALYFVEETVPEVDGVTGAVKPLRKRWNKVLRKHTGIQLLEVMEDKARGSLALYLDRALQLTDLGEHMYHEMMAHVPLFSVQKPPTDVLVIGAGDGGVTLRVLQHPSVKRVVQIELDGAVVNASRTYFPKLAAAYEDPRVQLFIQDAIAWCIREAPLRGASFDAVIIDSTDEPLVSIWTAEFYMALRRLLRKGGMLMQNAQSLDVPIQMDNLARLHHLGGFDYVRPILISTIDYGSPYIAYLSSDVRCTGPVHASEEKVNSLPHSWYSLQVHWASLAVPPAMARRWPDSVRDTEGCAGASNALSSVAESTVATAANAVDSSSAAAAEMEATEEDVEEADVVVVGGGMAGVTAAHVLAKHLGVQKILLLEAKERLGGRIETTDPNIFGGLQVNVGANWIHFATGNPILRLAEQVGCPTAPSENSRLRWAAAGVGELSGEAIEKSRKFAAELATRMVSDIPANRTSAASLLRELAQAVPESRRPKTAAEIAACHLHFFGDVVQDHTAYLGDLSGIRLCDNFAGGDVHGQDRHLAGERGASCLLDALLADVPMGSVKVTTGQAVSVVRERHASAERPMELVVRPGVGSSLATRRVRAKTVVLTAPLGVLKASVAKTATEGDEEGTCASSDCQDPSQVGLLKFEPAVPENQARQWARVGMGQSLRVALLFDKVFWNASIEFFSYLVDPTPKATRAEPLGGYFYGEAPAAEFTSALNITGQPVLLAEIGRHLADRFEGLPDREVVEFLVKEALTPMLPKATVPDPIAFSVKRYGADPFIRGGLSFPSVEEDSISLQDAGDRWAPLAHGKLLFAGEHTTKHRGTIDGAYFSGVQAAWNAACAMGKDLTSVLDLVRALGVFGAWFPRRGQVQTCIEKLAAKWYDAGGAIRTCRERNWLELLEVACRDLSSEKVELEQDGLPKRHCLDQGN